MKIHEDQLIERIRRRIPSAPGATLRVGIGDDAAVVRPSRGKEWVLTVDQFIEGVHFLGSAHPPEVVGYKALARATSDLAAMGALPRLFLLSIALPAHRYAPVGKTRTGSWLDEMLKGMAKAARRFDLRLAGGDTARSSSTAPASGSDRGPDRAKVAMQITVLGEVEAGRAVRRRGARPGDAIFVTGQLGAAQLGLELVLRGLHRQRRWQRLLIPHYYPVIHIELGRWLVRRRLASAMMDLSDGLSTDLARLCRASGVGACIYRQSLPCVTLPPQLHLRGCDPLKLGLHGGEDYGLLFTVPKRLVRRIPRDTNYHFNHDGTRLTRIGEIVRGRAIKLVGADGQVSPLEPRGWDHFRAS